MHSRRLIVAVGSTAALLVTVAGCTSSSDGNGTPTATVTDTVSSSASGTPTTPAPTDSSTGSTTPTGGSSGTTGNASGPGLCTPTVATFAVGPTEGAAGTAFFDIHVTNASQQPCVTTGFPGIALLDASGKQILQATRETTTTPATITLQPGEQATAQVGASNMGAAGSACTVTSPAFLFTLPDNTDSTKITHSTLACSVRVEAFVKGAGNG